MTIAAITRWTQLEGDGEMKFVLVALALFEVVTVAMTILAAAGVVQLQAYRGYSAADAQNILYGGSAALVVFDLAFCGMYAGNPYITTRKIPGLALTQYVAKFRGHTVPLYENNPNTRPHSTDRCVLIYPQGERPTLDNITCAFPSRESVEKYLAVVITYPHESSRGERSYLFDKPENTSNTYFGEEV